MQGSIAQREAEKMHSAARNVNKPSYESCASRKKPMTAGLSIVAMPHVNVDVPSATGIFSIPTYSTKRMLKRIMMLPLKSPRKREMVKKVPNVVK